MSQPPQDLPKPPALSQLPGDEWPFGTMVYQDPSTSPVWIVLPEPGTIQVVWAPGGPQDMAWIFKQDGTSTPIASGQNTYTMAPDDVGLAYFAVATPPNVRLAWKYV